MLAVIKRMPVFSQMHAEVDGHIFEVEQISRQLGGWLSSLQNSSIQGQRHLNDATRTRFDQDKRRREFAQEHGERIKEVEARILENQNKRRAQNSEPTHNDETSE